MTRFFPISCHRRVSAFSINSDTLHHRHSIPLLRGHSNWSKGTQSVKASPVIWSTPDIWQGRMIGFPALSAHLTSLPVTHALWPEADSCGSQLGSMTAHTGKVGKKLLFNFSGIAFPEMSLLKWMTLFSSEVFALTFSMRTMALNGRWMGKGTSSFAHVSHTPLAARQGRQCQGVKVSLQRYRSNSRETWVLIQWTIRKWGSKGWSSFPDSIFTRYRVLAKSLHHFLNLFTRNRNS